MVGKLPATKTKGKHKNKLKCNTRGHTDRGKGWGLRSEETGMVPVKIPEGVCRWAW